MSTCPKCGHTLEAAAEGPPKEYITQSQIDELGDYKADIFMMMRGELQENEKDFLKQRERWGFNEKNTVKQLRWFKSMRKKYLGETSGQSVTVVKTTPQTYDKPLSSDPDVPF